MLDEIRALLILQDKDRRARQVAKDLEQLPKDEARAKTRLAGDESAVKSAQDAIVGSELQLKRLELDAGTRRTTIQRLKTQQFETRKNEEFQALGHEITRYEKEIDDLETKELEIMEELDRLRAKLKAAEAARAKTKAVVEEDLATIRTRGENLHAKEAEIRAERETLAGGICPDTIKLYERLMKTKDGLALAPLADGKCGGCHMKVIPSTIVSVQQDNAMTRCENCGRILFTES